MLDAIIIAVIALLAVGYLLRRYLAAAKGKTSLCDCGPCGCACHCTGVSCNASHQLVNEESSNKRDEAGDSDPSSH
jgi:hypothetical protein